MAQIYRRGIGTAEKTELWDRRQHWELLKTIRRAIGKLTSTIYFQLALYWGYSSGAPSAIPAVAEPFGT